MAYQRRNVTDGITVMNKDLYDNLQDGIDDLQKSVDTLMVQTNVLQATIEEDTTLKE